MGSFLITWKEEEWPYAELKSHIDEHRADRSTTTPWRFAAYTKGQPGDRVFLLKQGSSPRGVFGRGSIASEPVVKLDGAGKSYGTAEIHFDALVDPRVEMLVPEAETLSIMTATQVKSRSSGVTLPEETADQLDHFIASMGPEKDVPTAEQFAEALQGMEADGDLSEIDRALLIEHYNAPGFQITSRVLSARIGKNAQIANSLYGRLGRRISDALHWRAAWRRRNAGNPKGEFLVSSLVTGSEEPEFIWTLRPQVAKAVEMLDWLGLELKQSPDEDAEDAHEGATLEERRRYKWQRRLERTSKYARFAKAHHGSKCQACEMSFANTYGDFAGDFIEAHHRVPHAQLKSGDEKRLSTPDKFAVLCSNCHRMIHRWPDAKNPRVDDVEGFSAMLRARRYQQNS